MAILDQNFLDVYNSVAPDNGGSSPIPPGEYNLTVSGASIEESKSGGQYIKVTFDVMGPSYQGRKIFQNFNIRHHNVDAVRIGAAQLKSLAEAGGITAFSDTNQLLGLNVTAKVTIRKSKDPQYPDQNEARGFKPIGATPPASASNGAFSDAFARPAGSEAKSSSTPWGF